MRDELVGLIASWDKSGREGDRQFFLKRGRHRRLQYGSHWPRHDHHSEPLSLALVFHMIGMALDPGRQPEISEANARRAAAWCDFLEQHARRCYGPLADGGGFRIFRIPL